MSIWKCQFKSASFCVCFGDSFCLQQCIALDRQRARGDPCSLAAHLVCLSDTSVSRYGLNHSAYLHLPEQRNVLTKNVKSLCPTSEAVIFSASLSPVPSPFCLPGDIRRCSLMVGMPDEMTLPSASDLMLSAGEKIIQKKIYTIRCCCHSSSEIFPLIYGSSCWSIWTAILKMVTLF